MNRTVLAVVAAALLAAVPMATAGPDEGQGPDPEGPCVVEDLNLGEYWYGSQITHDDLIGKVVLVEIWGS